MGKQAMLSDYERDVTADLDHLSEAERRAYVAVELNDMSPADHASGRGIDPSTARTLLYRARGKLGEREGVEA